MLEEPAGRDLVAWIPSERILIETDGPFFTWAGEPIEPCHVPAVVTQLASIRRERDDELRNKIGRNFIELTA
jgi:Tat protein secretion system quality control protein TatD with DNase activity